MSPVLSFGLTLAGVLLAGVPLLYLTADAPQKQIAPRPEDEAPSTRKSFVMVQFTGEPVSAVLRHKGKIIATMPAGTPSPWEEEPELPTHGTLELEAELHWPANSAENAVSITIEPPKQPAATDTRWTGSDGSLLHDIFRFSW